MVVCQYLNIMLNGTTYSTPAATNEPVKDSVFLIAGGSLKVQGVLKIQHLMKHEERLSLICLKDV